MNIKIAVPRSTYMEFSHVLKHYQENIYSLLSAKEYMHYYNLQSLVSDSAIKLSHPLFKSHKKIIISLNVNEFHTLRFLFTKNKTGYTIDRVIKDLQIELDSVNNELFFKKLDLQKHRRNVLHGGH